MTIHPHKPVAITQSPKRRRSDLVGPVALLAVAVMLGIGITAFASTPHVADVRSTTVGQTNR